MRAALIPLLFAITLAPSIAQAKDSVCQPPRISYEFSSSAPTLDRSLPFDELSRMSNAGPPSTSPALHSYDRVLGNYQSGRSLAVEADGEMITLPNGKSYACVRSARVIQTLRPSIRLAAEIPPGSCTDAQVWQHELHHFDIDSQVAAGLRSSVENAHAKPRPWHSEVASEKEASDFIHGYQQWLFYRTNSDFNNASRPAQGRHDSLEEYDRVLESCPGEVSKMGYGDASAASAVSRSAYGAPSGTRSFKTLSSLPPPPTSSPAPAAPASSSASAAPQPAPASIPSARRSATPYGAANPWVPF